jgi:hypothetical protein
MNILHQRSTDVLGYSINCSLKLLPEEVITNIVSVAPVAGLIFGPLTINALPITFEDGSVGNVGQVISFQISTTLPEGTFDTPFEIRVTFNTNMGNTRTADVQLVVGDFS